MTLPPADQDITAVASLAEPTRRRVYDLVATARTGLTRDDVAHLATLARIDLSEAELDHLSGELAVILESVATVSSAPIAGVEPMSHPMPIVNVTRPDVVRPSLAPGDALAGAPESEQQRFSVPRILDQE